MSKKKNYTESLHLRISPEMKEQLEDFAEENEQPLQNAIRLLLKKGIDRKKQEDQILQWWDTNAVNDNKKGDHPGEDQAR